mgnify:CR=1 FL=1
MNALLLTLFVSLILGAVGVLFFLNAFARDEMEHTDRLSLAPLADDEPVSTAAPAASASTLSRRADAREELPLAEAPAEAVAKKHEENL